MNSALLEKAIRGTNDDAIISKLSAVNTGYIQDPFVKYFVRKPSRRPPIINRGTYIRSAGIDFLIKKFLQTDHGEELNSNKQIVSLGAGSDTRYFHFKSNNISFKKYFEIDYPEITAKKIAVIRKHQELAEIIGRDAQLGMGGAELYASDYCLLSGDLKDFVEHLVPRMESHGFDKSFPTLFLSECVLIYMEHGDSDMIIQWISESMEAAMFIIYEQILPDDAFGVVMLQNLRLRNIELRGIQAYPDVDSQKNRFVSRGWTFAGAVDINQLHDHYIDHKELSRVSQLEVLDELEEWRLLAAHYCITWAYIVKDASHDTLFQDVKYSDSSLEKNEFSNED
ncbi:hypothetical protein G9A89_023490 [Geosiphon pyriformis]|nr:hypothetical protein G9A89_023490 [Geosiphon pyriformis]